MAILRQGILGGFINKIGTVVGYRWVGLDVIRGYVIPKNPKTVDQTIQRNKFSSCLPFAQAIYRNSNLVYFWDIVKGSSKTAWAAILKENIAACQATAISDLQRVLPRNVTDYLPTTPASGALNFTATIPALNSFLEIPEGSSSVSFAGVLAFSQPEDPSANAQLITGLAKNIPAFNFTTPYSLTIPLSAVQIKASEGYNVKMNYICVVIKDINSNILAGLSPTQGTEE